MKTRIFLVVLAAVAITSPGFICSKITETPSGEALLSMMKADMQYLSSDELEGRGTGTEGEKKAGEFLIQRFQSMGIKPQGTNGTWYQQFSYRPHPTITKHAVGDSVSMGMSLVQEIQGTNIIGFLDNKAKTTVIIGAHYDHLGWGDEGSLFTEVKAIHNGADDNASGVVSLLELTRRISSNPQHYKSNNFLFIAFSGEEKGLWGSNYFCKNPTIDLTSANYMINMDMVGRLNAEKALAINGVGTSSIWMQVLPKIQVDSIKIITSESGIGPSDHTSFYNTGIPAIHFFTGQHSDYHKPSDDADKINYVGMRSVVDYIDQLLLLLNTAGKVDFQKTKDEQQQAASDWKVTLGVIPDYLYDGVGLRLDGTKEGRPAAKAGLQKMDVVIKIGEYEIKDIYAYMESLGKFQKGETTPIVILREGKEMTLMVTWD